MSRNEFPSFTIRVTPEPAHPGEAPAEVRVRKWLRQGLRKFRLRARWAPDAITPGAGKVRCEHEQAKSKRCKSATSGHRQGREIRHEPIRDRSGGKDAALAAHPHRYG